MEQANLLREITENLPAFFCVAEIDSGKVLMLNQAATNLFGDIETISETGVEGIFQATTGEKIDGRFEYNAKIGSRWYWISNYPVSWAEDQKAEVFLGVEHGAFKNFSDLANEDVFSEGMKGPVNMFDRLEKHVVGYKKGLCDAFTVAYLDIDGVKMVNDRFGESEGDTYVRTIIEVIRSSIRSSDIFVHVGGDDFLIIFPTCTHAVVENIMEVAVKKLDVINVEIQLDYDYSVSYGIFEVANDENSDMDVIMSSLKQRMKDMKESKLQSRRGFYYMPAGSISSSQAI